MKTLCAWVTNLDQRATCFGLAAGGVTSTGRGDPARGVMRAVEELACERDAGLEGRPKE